MKSIKIRQNNKAIFFAILAAALYALNVPFSKMLLNNVSPLMMAAFLYIGAGMGMLVLLPICKLLHLQGDETKLTKKDLPYTIAMVVLDIAAPIFLMFGLKTTAAANASLLNNFEIVATALIAMLFFKEKIGIRLWIAIILVTVSCALLTIEDASSFSFSTGSLLVLAACICWGLENNCTRNIADKDPMEIVIIKGFGSGFGALAIAFCAGETIPNINNLIIINLLGFIAYGLSIFFYTYAQRGIGAAKTSTFYAVAPFIGMLLSFFFLSEQLTAIFAIALVIMIIGAYLATTEKKKT